MAEQHAVKLLIVDDQSSNLDVLEAMLEPLGCECVRAESADDALLALLRHDFAAMVLDIRMPGMSGIELATLIRQRKRTHDVPILFLTAHMVDDDEVLRGYGVGAVDYLSKPINPNILRSKIAVFVELFRKTRALAELNDILQREVAERQKAQELLEQINQELELRVRERTAALAVAHRGVMENEERLRMAVDVAQIAAWEWTSETGRMAWSTDPETLFGFPEGSFGPELRILRAVHPEDKDRIERTLAAALESGTYEGEYRVVRPDGSIVWITERGQVVRRDDGSIEKMVGVSRDVSAQRRAEQERERLLVAERKAREEAERQSRLKDEFLATLSHELRTPMNAILGWLSMLTGDQGVKDPRKAITAIQRNAQMQARLIEDLLEMNKLTAGNVRLERRLVDMTQVIDAAVQALQPTADAKGVQLAASIEATVPTISADARRLQQIMWNLLHNAIKFTPAGGRVGVRVRPLQGTVQVVIADTGQGIAPTFLPHVFERFRQEDPSTTRASWGLGLGLSIVKHLVELHGGTVEARSGGIGCGSTFVVELPATPRTDVGATPPAGTASAEHIAGAV